MENRYLFKAKRIDNGEWVRGGSLITFCDNDVKSYYMPQFSEKCVCEHDDITDDILSFSDCRFYKVDESTLCQCTSLKDKNKKLIWENDIVGTFSQTYNKYSHLGSVKYGNFNCSCCNGVYGWYFDKDADIRDAESCEVLGNIFDNPELLEVE